MLYASLEASHNSMALVFRQSVSANGNWLRAWWRHGSALNDVTWRRQVRGTMTSTLTWLLVHVIKNAAILYWPPPCGPWPARLPPAVRVNSSSMSQHTAAPLQAPVTVISSLNWHNQLCWPTWTFTKRSLKSVVLGWSETTALHNDARRMWEAHTEICALHLITNVFNNCVYCSLHRGATTAEKLRGGGQDWVPTPGRLRLALPPAVRVRGITPENFWKLRC